MTISSKYRKKYWIKTVCSGIFYSCLVAFMFHFTNKSIPDHLNINPFYAFIIGTIISICIPYFVEFFYKNGKVLPNEFNYIEEQFESYGNDLIIERFGENIVESQFNHFIQLGVVGIAGCDDDFHIR